MAVTPAILLAKLQGLNIDTEVIDHPAVLTVEVNPPRHLVLLEIALLSAHALAHAGGQ